MLNPTALSPASKPLGLAGNTPGMAENPQIPGDFAALLALGAGEMGQAGAEAAVPQALVEGKAKPASGNAGGKILPELPLPLETLPLANLPQGMVASGAQEQAFATRRDDVGEIIEALPMVLPLTFPAVVATPIIPATDVPHPAGGEPAPLAAAAPRMPVLAAGTVAQLARPVVADPAVQAVPVAPVNVQSLALSPETGPQPAIAPSLSVADARPEIAAALPVARMPPPPAALPAREPAQLGHASLNPVAAAAAPAAPASATQPRPADIAPPSEAVARVPGTGNSAAQYQPSGERAGGEASSQPGNSAPARFDPAALQMAAIDPAAPLAGELQPVMALREAVATGPAAIATAPAAPNRPTGDERQDIAALVDRLAEALDAASPGTVRAAVRHAEFGQVTLRIQPDEGGLSVAMTSRDPDFAPAVQAVAAAGQSSGAGDSGSAPQRQDAQGQQQPGGSTSGNAQAQAQGFAQARTPARDSASDPAAQPPADQTSPADPQGTERPGRGGIYA